MLFLLLAHIVFSEFQATSDVAMKLEVTGHKWISNECCPFLLIWIRTVHSKLDDCVNGQPHLHRKQAHFANGLSRTIMSPLVLTPWPWCTFIFYFKSNEETFKGTNDVLYNKELRSLKSGYCKYYPNYLKITDQIFDQINEAWWWNTKLLKNRWKMRVICLQ